MSVYRIKADGLRFHLSQMLKVSFTAHKDVDYVILDILIPFLDFLPPPVGVGKGRLVSNVIGDNDGVGTHVVKLSFNLLSSSGPGPGRVKVRSGSGGSGGSDLDLSYTIFLVFTTHHPLKTLFWL